MVILHQCCVSKLHWYSMLPIQSTNTTLIVLWIQCFHHIVEYIFHLFYNCLLSKEKSLIKKYCFPILPLLFISKKIIINFRSNFWFRHILYVCAQAINHIEHVWKQLATKLPHKSRIIFFYLFVCFLYFSEYFLNFSVLVK